MQKSRKNVPNGATLEVWVDPNTDSANISALAGFGDSFEQAFQSKAEFNSSSEAQPVQYLLGEKDVYLGYFKVESLSGETKEIKTFFQIVEIDGKKRKVVRKKDSFTSNDGKEAFLFIHMLSGGEK